MLFSPFGVVVAYQRTKLKLVDALAHTTLRALDPDRRDPPPMVSRNHAFGCSFRDAKTRGGLVRTGESLLDWDGSSFSAGSRV